MPALIDNSIRRVQLPALPNIDVLKNCKRYDLETFRDMDVKLLMIIHIVTTERTLRVERIARLPKVAETNAKLYRPFS